MTDGIVYLDHCATTQPALSAVEAANAACAVFYANPSAQYAGGRLAHEKLGAARKTVAAALGSSCGDIVFTSGGTEADNLAVFGSFYGKRGNYVTTLGEHEAVYACFKELEARGQDVRFARINRDGSVDAGHLMSLIDGETKLVSVIHVSNETGAVNPVAALFSEIKRLFPAALTHSDGVQAFLKIPFRLDALSADLYTVSAHKVNALKGTGALYVNKGVRLKSLLSGAGQEGGLRPGTENVPGICAFAAAAETLSKNMEKDVQNNAGCRAAFVEELKTGGADFLELCPDSAPHILSVAFSGIKSEILVSMLSDEGIYAGRGSACSSRSKTSRVLTAAGLPAAYAEGVMRFSFGQGNTADEVRRAARTVARKAVQLSRKIKK